MKKRKKINRLEARRALFLCLAMFCIISILASSAYAWEWDNVKSYDPQTKTATISNALGLGGTIAKVTLKTPQIYYVPAGDNVKVAEFEINNYDNYLNVFNNLEFLNLKKQLKKETKNFIYKIKTTKSIPTTKYKDVCSDTWANGTLKCHPESYVENIYIDEWKEINPAEGLPKGISTIGIFTKVNVGDSVEWIPTLFGVKINEWAVYVQTAIDNFDDASLDASLWDTVITRTDTITETGGYVEIQGEGGDADHSLKTSNLTSKSTWDIFTQYSAVNITFHVTQFQTGGGGNNKDRIIVTNGTTQGVLVEAVALYGAGQTINDKYGYIRKVGTNQYYYDFDGQGERNTNMTGNISFRLSVTTEPATADHWIQLDWINATVEIPAPNIQLISPVNGYNSSIASISFNGTANYTTNIANMSLYINGVRNFTDTYSDTEAELNVTINGFTEGNYNWSMDVVGDDNNIAWTGNNSFNIDLSAPIVNITYPTNGASILISTEPSDIQYNFTASDLSLSNCWFYNESSSANVSLACGQNVTINLTSGYHNITYYANDSLGNLGTATATYFLNYVTADLNSSEAVFEFQNQTIKYLINASLISSLNSSLIWNGTVYPTTTSYNSSNGLLSASFLTPSFPNNKTENVTFYFNYSLNGVIYNTANYSQLVVYITPLQVEADKCTTLSPAMCWDFKNELNQSAEVNQTINYNFKFGVSNSTQKSVYGTISPVTTFCLCVNSTAYNNYTLGEGEIVYSKGGWADRRFYTFSTQRLSNETINNTLYMLQNEYATSFLFEFKDTSLAPYIEKYSALLRWYPDLDEYRSVEMAKTDDKGQTIMRVQTEDADYRVALYHQNGTLIKLLNAVRFACLSSPCSYSSIIEETPSDYTSFFNVEANIVFNTTTNLWTLTYNDPTQNTQEMRFVVTRLTGTSTFEICDNSASGYTGVITCDSSGYTGTLRGIAYRTASPEIIIAQKTVDTSNTVFKGTIGLFLSFILFLVLVLIGIVSPVISVILGIVALVPAYFIGSITLPILIGIAVIGGIVIHFMKRTG